MLLCIAFLVAVLTGTNALEKTPHNVSNRIIHRSQAKNNIGLNAWKPLYRDRKTVSDIVTIQVSKDGHPKVMIGSKYLPASHAGKHSKSTPRQKPIHNEHSVTASPKPAQKHNVASHGVSPRHPHAPKSSDLTNLYHRAEKVGDQLCHVKNETERAQLCSYIHTIDEAIKRLDPSAKTIEHTACIRLRQLNPIQKQRFKSLAGKMNCKLCFIKRSKLHATALGLGKKSRIKNGLGQVKPHTHQSQSKISRQVIKTHKRNLNCTHNRPKPNRHLREKRAREIYFEEHFLHGQLRKGLLTEGQRKSLENKLKAIRVRRHLQGLVKSKIMLTKFERKLLQLRHQEEELRHMISSAAATSEMRTLINRYLSRLRIRIERVKRRAMFERQQAELQQALMNPDLSATMRLALQSQLKAIRKQIDRAVKKGVMLSGVSRKRYLVKKQIAEIKAMVHSKTINSKVRRLLQVHLRNLGRKLRILDEQHVLEKQIREVQLALQGHLTPIMRKALKIQLRQLQQRMVQVMHKSHPVNPYDSKYGSMKRQLKQLNVMINSPVMNFAMRKAIRAQIEHLQKNIKCLTRQKAIKRQTKELQRILAGDDLSSAMRRDLKKQLWKLENEFRSVAKCKGHRRKPRRAVRKVESAERKKPLAVRKSRREIDKETHKTGTKIRAELCKRKGKGCRESAKKPRKSVRKFPSPPKHRRIAQPRPRPPQLFDQQKSLSKPRWRKSVGSSGHKPAKLRSARPRKYRTPQSQRRKPAKSGKHKPTRSRRNRRRRYKPKRSKRYRPSRSRRRRLRRSREEWEKFQSNVDNRRE